MSNKRDSRDPFLKWCSSQVERQEDLTSALRPASLLAPGVVVPPRRTAGNGRLRDLPAVRRHFDPHEPTKEQAGSSYGRYLCPDTQARPRCLRPVNASPSCFAFAVPARHGPRAPPPCSAATACGPAVGNVRGVVRFAASRPWPSPGWRGLFAVLA